MLREIQYCGYKYMLLSILVLLWVYVMHKLWLKTYLRKYSGLNCSFMMVLMFLLYPYSRNKSCSFVLHCFSLIDMHTKKNPKLHKNIFFGHYCDFFFFFLLALDVICSMCAFQVRCREKNVPKYWATSAWACHGHSFGGLLFGFMKSAELMSVKRFPKVPCDLAASPQRF